MFEKVPVCGYCMRIYQFLNEFYARFEETLENIRKPDPPTQRFKNTIFLGLDPKLNDKVIAILKRQLDRMSKLQKTNRGLVSGTRPSTPNSRQTSMNMLHESRFSSEELQNGIKFLKKFESSRNAADVVSGRPPVISQNNTYRTSNTGTLREQDLNSRPQSPFIHVQKS